MLIVINRGCGGFDLSKEAIKELALRKGWKLKRDNWGDYIMVFPDGNESWWSPIWLDRKDSDLIAVVQELGEDANTEYTELKIVEIPDNIDWEIIENDDGSEMIAEKGHIWK